MKDLFTKTRFTKAKVISILAILFIAGEASVMYASTAPTGYSGATTSTCRNCHSSYALNNAGGSVTITGLPASYNAGQAYPISVVITHSASDRKKFGFSLKAINSAGTAVGTVSSTNTYAVVSGTELVSKNPQALTTATNTYTFNNLKWTAPAAPGANDQTIRFFVCGNACNSNGNESSDYVYTKNYSVPVTVTAVETIPEAFNDFRILGNPVKNNLVLSYSIAKTTELGFSVMTIDGKLIKSVNKGSSLPGNGQFTMDVSGIAAGVYFLKVNAGKETFTRKIVIE